MRSEIFNEANAEVTTAERWIRQSDRMVKVTLGADALAVKGAMVAYQGSVTFQHEGSGSVGKFLRRALTSEDTPLMRVAGQGEVFFARRAQHVFFIMLEGDGISINGTSLLAFDATLSWDVQDADQVTIDGGIGVVGAKGTKVVYEGSRPIDITLTSAEFSALMSMHHYSPNWLVQDFQVKFGENGQLEMSGYVVWDGRLYGGYAQADAQLTGPQSVGGSITKLEGLGIEIPQEYNGPAGDYIAGVMNDWLSQMEGLNLQSATIEGGQLHIVGTVPARVVRVPAGQ